MYIGVLHIYLAVADKIPGSVLEEAPKFLMLCDQAVTRIGDA